MGGQCKTVYVSLDAGSGDADLYAHQNQINETFVGNCPETTCDLCRSRRGPGGKDYCKINSEENQFYLSVHAYSSFTDGILTVRGVNLDQVTFLGLFELATTTSPAPTNTTSTSPNPSTENSSSSST